MPTSEMCYIIFPFQIYSRTCKTYNIIARMNYGFKAATYVGGYYIFY